MRGYWEGFKGLGCEVMGLRVWEKWVRGRVDMGVGEAVMEGVAEEE